MYICNTYVHALHTHNKLFLRHTEELSPCEKMDGTKDHHVKRSGPDAER